MEPAIRDRLLPAFRDDARRVRVRIATAVAAEPINALDLDDARRDVHGLKGAAGVLGLPGAVALCRSIERVLQTLGPSREAVPPDLRAALDEAAGSVVAVAATADDPDAASVGRDVAELERLVPLPGARRG